MKNPYRCVIDKNKNYVTFVLMVEDENGDAAPYSYALKEGEVLIEASPPGSMIKPQWSGKEWEETGTKEITAEDMEQLRSAKLSEIGAACTAAITSGVNVETSEGTKHFSLTASDQSNLTGLMIASGAMEHIPYHADGEICKPWPVAEFQKIATAAIQHITYHTTYCNHLNVWIRREEDYLALQGIVYGAALPDDLAANMQQLLTS